MDNLPRSGAFALTHWATVRCLRDDARRIATIREAIEAACNHATACPAETVRWLAHRERYADAITMLAAIARPKGQTYGFVATIVEPYVPDSLRLLRLAILFGAVRAPDKNTPPPVPSRAKLRRTAAGRMALAASGDLPNWRTASRRERAAFLLWSVIRERSP